MKEKVLVRHIMNCKKQLQELSKHASILEHRGNLGIAREGFINKFLKNNLAEYINFNDGEIFDSEGNRTGQLDIILHPISSPKLNIYETTNLFPIETVLSVIEVKSELSLATNTKSQNIDILESCKKVKLLKNINKKDLWNLPYIVFAYKGAKKEIIIKNINNYIGNPKNSINLGDLPDIIYVLEKDYCLIKCQNYYEVGKTVESCYKEVFSDTEPLLGVFRYLLKLTEEWYAEPKQNTMPIDKYIEKEVDGLGDDW